MSDTYPHKLSATKIGEFEERGFAVTPNVLDEQEIERYAIAIDAEVARRTAQDTRAVSEKTTYEQSFIQCMRLWETCPDIAPLTCHAGLAGVAAQLLNVRSVRLWQDQALYKEAGGRETTAHQDQVFWPIGMERLVSAWIPLEDVTLANGAMAYVPGSHKAGRLKVVDITHQNEPYDVLNDPALHGAQPEPVAVTSGSVIWHHGLTVHQALANTTTKTRRVFTIVYLDAAATRSASWQAYPLDRDGVASGARIEGPGMPILWPALSELPTPPSDIGVAVGPQYTRKI